MADPRPRPITNDPDTGGFFRAAAAGRIDLRQCQDCGHIVHLPRAVCDRCHGWNTSWTTVASTGVLVSYTVVEEQVHPSFPAPYTIVLVEIDDAEGARLIGSIPGRPALTIGMAMDAWFEEAEGCTLPQWRPTTD